MALHPDLANVIIEIEANSSHAESIAHGLSPSQFNWRPEPDQPHKPQWSIAECLGHLNIVNSRDLEPLRQAIAAGRPAPPRSDQRQDQPYDYGFLVRKFITSMDVPVKKKFKAPAVYLPPAQADPAPTLAEYRRLCSELRRLCESANSLDLARTKTTLPALPAPLRLILRMPLGARLTVLATHDRRHLFQAEQVRNHPQFPA